MAEHKRNSHIQSLSLNPTSEGAAAAVAAARVSDPEAAASEANVAAS
jgi:hypothetical protein